MSQDEKTHSICIFEVGICLTPTIWKVYKFALQYESYMCPREKIFEKINIRSGFVLTLFFWH